MLSGDEHADEMSSNLALNEEEEKKKAGLFVNTLTCRHVKNELSLIPTHFVVRKMKERWQVTLILHYMLHIIGYYRI